MVAVGAAVGAPDFILPWLDRFYDDDDAELILAASGTAGDDGEGGRDTAPLADADAARLARAVRRAVLDRDEAGACAPSDFHSRLEIWAMFEGWKDVPLAVHRRLADWDVDHYADKIREDVQAVRDGRPGDSYEARYSYVLLHEAEAIVAAQDNVYLWPCDCRSIVSKCRKPMDVCLRFKNHRGLGWEISKERAVQILRAADKAGLMHTADLHDDPRGTSAICNCCTDCCYPHLATERLGTGDVWPVRRHVARIDMGLCKACGRCSLRCPFEAIVCSSEGRPELDDVLCRGCGLCATGCSADAIGLVPLRNHASDSRS
jgi:Pyruvate/2-oxoacid:ferredoxin oxidoreductase delta subunit